MAAVSYALLRRGTLSIPGALGGTKTLVEELLHKDAEEHHCYFRSAGLHNHLSHHLLAAYDLGAPAGLIQKIYDSEVKSQRPIFVEQQHKGIVVTENNWTEHLGNQDAYGSYVKYFKNVVANAGVTETLENYIFSPAANDGGTVMLVRLMSGALHPFIQVGYGLEFGNSALVATGLAQTAIHKPTASQLHNLEIKDKPLPSADGSTSITSGPSVLELLREVYDSQILHPIMPYDPNALISKRLLNALQGGRPEEIRRICSRYTLATSSPEAAAEDLMWAAVLLLCSTGRAGREPRLDFFLMHLVTSSIFFRPFLSTLRDPRHKSALVRAYLPGFFLYVLSRGRPRIDASLLMAQSAVPRPPQASGTGQPAHQDALGSPSEDAEYNPWPTLLASVTYAPDSHVVKTLRSLAFAAREYGQTPAGGVRGAFVAGDKSKESHPGMAKVDGSLFIRAAGMVMNYMGWVSHGQPARPDWDRSALGWDAAWDQSEVRGETSML